MKNLDISSSASTAARLLSLRPPLLVLFAGIFECLRWLLRKSNSEKLKSGTNDGKKN